MAAGQVRDQLELIAPSGQVTFFDLDPARGVANIGRHPDNDIVVDGPAIHPFHAILDYHDKPYRLIWLDTTAGPPCQLNTCDVIPLDGYSLVLVSSGATQPASAGAPTVSPASAAVAAIAAPESAASPISAAEETPVGAPPAVSTAEPEIDLDMLDAILTATEAQKDDVIVVEVQVLSGNVDQKSKGDLDLAIDAGETATLEATIINGGDIVASFDVTLPGLPPSWVSVSPAQVNLQEGGRVSVLISITPPRKASVRARGYFYAVLVRSPEHPGRQSSTPGMLVVKPFHHFTVGNLDPRQQAIPYSKRAGVAVLPLVNLGNSEAGFRVEGEDDRRLCRFEFEAPGEKVAQASRVEVRVPPEQTLPLPMHIIPTKRPLVGLGRVNHPFTVTVTPLDSRQTPRSVLGQAQVAPLIGPIPIVLLALLLALLFILIYRPAIHSFDASSRAISAGETVSLTWKASQFSGLRLEPGAVGLPGIQGTVLMAPTLDTLYTLSADNLLSRLAPKWFQATRQVHVAVSAVLPAFRQFSADHTTATVGDTVNVAWDVDRADSLTLIINGAAETLLPKEYIGNRALKLDKKTVVQLVAVNAYTPPEGVSRSLVLEVVPVPPVIPPPPVIKRFDITPQDIVAGQVVVLNWEVTGVSKITITGVGELPANGSVSVAPPNDMIYTLTASNGMPGGSVSREQQVIVRPAPTPTPLPGTPKIEFLKATPSNAVLGSAEANSVQISWLVSGDVTNIELSGTGSTSKSSGLPKSGTLSVAVDKQTLYILTAYNGNLSASQTVQVTVSNPVPVANSLEPSTTEATGGTAGLVVVVNGANFNKDSRVRVSGADRPTTFINTGRLSAALLATDVKSAGTLNIVVFTPTPGGGTSSLLTLTIVNPKPALSQVSPPFLFTGGADTTISISGYGFVNPDSKVYFGATQRRTTFLNSTLLSAAITALDLATPGTVPITVRNPGPGGVSFISNVVDFQIKSEYPVPELVDISPNMATVGGQGFTLVITGTNDTFVRDTTLVNWQGTYLPNVVFVDTNHLSVYVSADLLPAQVGTVNVSAVNPAPGGGQSNIITFTMGSPELTLSPSSVAMTLISDPAKPMNLALSGAQRGDISVALVSSSPSVVAVPSSVVIPAGSTSVTFTVTASSLSTGQGITLTATLPITLGSQTAQAVASVVNPAPSLSSSALNPSWRQYQSGGFALQVTGVNFVPTSIVRWNGSARPTTYNSSTRLTASIYASDMATGGPVAVTVFNPTPGGGLTGSADFDVRYLLWTAAWPSVYGTVSSPNPPGINCGWGGSTCQVYISSDTTTNVTLQAQPRSGFAFSGWSGDCIGMTPSCTLTMNRNRSVRANFNPAFDLTLNQTGEGIVTSTPPGIDTSSCITCSTFTAAFVRGSTVYLLASSTPSARFVGWGGACSGVSPYCTVRMLTPVSVSATFIPQYLLSVTKVGTGGGLVTSNVAGIDCGSFCQASYTSGTSVTLSAVADASSAFTGWGGSCAANGTASTCTLTIASANITDVTASFTPIRTVTLNKLNPAGGLVSSSSTPAQTNFICDASCSTQVLTYLDNTSLVFTATAYSGYAFVRWTGVSGCTTGSTCTVVVGSNQTITADFEPLYAISAAVSGSGQVAGTHNAGATYPNISCPGTCGPVAYPATTVFTFTASAGSGFAFSGWASGPCSGAATNPCVFTVSAAATATANFVPLRTLTVSPGANGAVSSTPAGISNCRNPSSCTANFAEGTSVTLNASPDNHYLVSSWTVNGAAACGTATSCPVTMSTDTTVTVTFLRDTRTLTVSPYPTGGSVSETSPGTQISGCSSSNTANCSGTYDHNTPVTLQATATTGYSFVTWTGDCTNTTPTCNVTLNNNATVGATFAINTYALSVTMGGAGAGTVTSDPSGISCSSGTCSHSYNYGTVVTLTAAASTGSTFAGWSGACTGTGSCSVTMTAARSATATFNLNSYSLSATVSGAGAGTVTSNPSGISCSSGTCSHSYNYGTVVTLTAAASTGSTFASWSGACTGTGSCNVTIDAARAVTASFTLNTYPLTVSVTAQISGTVTSNPAGINCGGTCISNFDYNSSVTLTASPSLTTTTGITWSGGCTGTGWSTNPILITTSVPTCNATFLP